MPLESTRRPIGFVNTLEIIPTQNRFESSLPESAESRARTPSPAHYVESECTSLIALLKRLDVVPALENELKLIADQTWPEFESMLKSFGSKYRTLRMSLWPYEVQQAEAPWKDIPISVWHGWAIHLEVSSLAARTKRLPKLAEIHRRAKNMEYYERYHKNMDGTVNKDVLPTDFFAIANTSAGDSVSFDEYCALEKQLADKQATADSKRIREEMQMDTVFIKWVRKLI